MYLHSSNLGYSTHWDLPTEITSLTLGMTITDTNATIHSIVEFLITPKLLNFILKGD